MEKICARCGKKKDLLSWETMCYKCQMEAAEEKTVEEIKRGEATSTFAEDNVICPWCGSVRRTNVGWEDFPESYEDGTHEMVCDEFGKLFELTTRVSYSYDTERIEED